MSWTPKSWNTCQTKTCRGPVEGPGGDVTFFDGGEAHCIECDREYMVHVMGDEAWLEAVPKRKAKAS